MEAKCTPKKLKDHFENKSDLNGEKILLDIYTVKNWVMCWKWKDPTLSVNWSETFTRVTYWRSFCRAKAVPILFLLAQKHQILVMTMCLGLSTALSSSPTVTACLLESPPCTSDCAERHRKPSGSGIYWCAILGELSRYHLIPPGVTLTLAKCKNSEKKQS